MDEIYDSSSQTLKRCSILRNKSDSTNNSWEAPRCSENRNNTILSRLSCCDYVIERRLGRGSFGEVFMSREGKTNEEVALKKIPKRSAHFNKRALTREIQAGTRLSHPGIVQFKNFFETENSFYLIYELLHGMDLYSFMKQRNFIPLRESEVISLMRQLIIALVYCHNQNTCHRDIKWENVFLTEDGTVKLIDFGLSAHISPDDLCPDFVGSPYFAAPEILARQTYSGFKADVFSCGMVLYGLLYGRLDVRRTEMGTILWPDRYQSDFPFFVSRAAKDLLSCMLEEDPFDRIAMEQVSKHKWFQQNIKSEEPLSKM